MKPNARILSVSKISFVFVIILLITFTASQLISTGNANLGPRAGSGTGFRGAPKELSNNNGVGHVTMDVSPNCMYDSSDFKTMGDSVERALNFYDQNIDKLVLDAAAGTRSLEGSVEYFCS